MVVDFCTGSGAVALAIAKFVPSADVLGVDVSGTAVDLGRLNAKKLEVDNVSFRQGDLASALPSTIHGKVDLVTAFLPYFATTDILVERPNEEPINSWTDGSADGMGLLRRLIVELPDWVVEHGTLLVQIGKGQTASAVAQLTHGGYEVRCVLTPSTGNTQIIEAIWLGPESAFSSLSPEIRERAFKLFRYGR
jgi:release factor glutamine methyltransferase